MPREAYPKGLVPEITGYVCALRKRFYFCLKKHSFKVLIGRVSWETRACAYITSLLIELFLYMRLVYLMLNRLISFDRLAWPCRASKWCVICALIHQWHRLWFRLLFLDTLVLHFCIWAGVMVFWWFFFQFRWLYQIPISPASPLLISGPNR